MFPPARFFPETSEEQLADGEFSITGGKSVKIRMKEMATLGKEL